VKDRVVKVQLMSVFIPPRPGVIVREHLGQHQSMHGYTHPTALSAFYKRLPIRGCSSG
jgi:hypothetical protein